MWWEKLLVWCCFFSSLWVKGLGVVWVVWCFICRVWLVVVLLGVFLVVFVMLCVRCCCWCSGMLSC